MNNQIISTETITYRRTTITLAKCIDGFWGYSVGKHVMLPFFAFRGSALRSAQRLVDSLKK